MVVRPRRVCRRERVKGNIEAFGLSRKGGVTSGDGEVSGKSRLGEGQDFTFCDSMDGIGEYLLSEISQSEKDKYRMISFICEI